MDIFHTLTNIVDHNRWTSIFGAIAIGVLGLSGCDTLDGRVVSSTSGEVLDSDGIQGEYVKERKRLRDEYDEAERDARDATSRMASISSQAAELEDLAESDLQAINAELEARRGVMMGIGDVLTAAGVSVPWLGPLIGVAGASVAVGVGLDNRRKDRVIQSTKTGESS